MKKSFVAQEVVPAVCIPLALVVILLLFLSCHTKKAGFPDLQCSFCTVSSVIITFLLKSVNLKLLLNLVTNVFLYVMYKRYSTI